MIKTLLVLSLACAPVLYEESTPEVEISDVTEISEDVQVKETEESVIKEYYEAIISELKAEVDKYKGKIENEAVRTILESLIVFLSSLAALYLKFRSFDKSTLTLDESKKLLKIAKDEITSLTKDVQVLTNRLNESNKSVDDLTQLTNQSLKVINATLLRLIEKVDKLEKGE